MQSTLHTIQKQNKNDAWESLVRNINLPQLSVAQKKMESSLGSFRREKAKTKRSEGTRKGAMDIYKSKWFAFDSIQFLMNRDEPRKGVNTENDEAELDDLEVSRESNKEQAQLEDEGVDMRSPAPSIQSFHSQPSSASLPTLKRNKKQKQPAEDPRLQRAFEIMESASNRRRSAQHIAQKLIGYSVRTRALVEREINTVLFRADMGYCDDSPACTITMRQIVPNPPSTVTALPEYPAAILHNFRPSPHYTYTTPSTPAPSPQNANLTSFIPTVHQSYQ
nr:uncharacterized protein LOC111508231 [Leptinotarsa decemlineata]